MDETPPTGLPEQAGDGRAREAPAGELLWGLGARIAASSLLHVLEWALCASEAFYQENVRHFDGALLIRTQDDLFQAKIVFRDGEVRFDGAGVSRWDVIVTFRSVASIWDGLVRGRSDVLALVTSGDVVIEGNINHLYRLLALFRELGHRVGLAPGLR